MCVCVCVCVSIYSHTYTYVSVLYSIVHYRHIYVYVCEYIDRGVHTGRVRACFRERRRTHN
jgi:hypothetical protein